MVTPRICTLCGQPLIVEPPKVTAHFGCCFNAAYGTTPPEGY